MKWHGKSTKGINPAFLNKVAAAATAAGAKYVYVISGRRTPATNTGVKNSNHLTGHAMDAYAVMADGSKIPLGTLLKGTAGSYGLRSGDQPGFYKGGPDPNHVDDGYNVHGGKPAPASQDATQVATQTGPTTQTVSDTGYDDSAQLAGAIGQIPQVAGPPLANAPLVGDQVDTSVAPRSAGQTWQLIASQGQVSPDTIRLAQLASYGADNATSG